MSLKFKSKYSKHKYMISYQYCMTFYWKISSDFMIGWSKYCMWWYQIFFHSYIITARKQSCGKVIFLHLSVILFTGGGGFSVQGVLCPWGVSVGGGGCLGQGSSILSDRIIIWDSTLYPGDIVMVRLYVSPPPPLPRLPHSYSQIYSDRLNGFQTESTCHHWHNDKLWHRQWRWRTRAWRRHV